MKEISSCVNMCQKKSNLTPFVIINIFISTFNYEFNYTFFLSNCNWLQFNVYFIYKLSNLVTYSITSDFPTLTKYHCVEENNVQPLCLYRCLNNFNYWQVTEWILNSGTNNGILVVTALPSGIWFESSIRMKGQSDETNAYLVIYSDDGRKHYQHPPFYTGN